MKRTGIDMGTSSIKITITDNEKIQTVWCKDHHGHLLDTLIQGLEETKCTGLSLLGITGSASMLLKDQTDKNTRIEMIPAIVEGVKHTCPQAHSIMDIGGQGSRFISDGQAEAPVFHANEHCAGGTGAFFEDQMQRLGMKIEDYSKVVLQADKVPSISGRCAVFAKTDIIHRQQEGVTTPDILNGLCYALVRNYRAVIMRSLPLLKPVAFIGGVTLNAGMKRAILDVLKLREEDLIIPPYARNTASIGAALLAVQETDMDLLLKQLKTMPSVQREAVLPPLKLEKEMSLKDPEALETIGNQKVYLGIDIGSTSTDLVLMREDGQLIDFQYLRTAGNPEKAVRNGLHTFHEKYGDFPVQSVGITGSGRVRIGRMLGADVIKDEITAQAEGASAIVRDVDTVFEIGGQDSKYISLQKGRVVDFQMNKICAAGTGSFIEEQASRMNIPLDQFGSLAMTSKSPSMLGERCTVFIETSIDTALGKGASSADVSAGLAYAIVRNYLDKVVGEKPVGKKIVLQGGVCYNPSIVAAFETAFPERTFVNPYFSISGAYGAARLAQKAGIVHSTFKGWNFDSSLSPLHADTEEIRKNKAFFHQSEKLLLGNYTGQLDPDKKTIGIPYVLLMHHFFPLAYTFFTDLGFNVLLTKPTNADTISLSQEKAVGETCYPVKLMFGHIQQLIDAHVDYIFMPLVHTMKHELSTVRYNYGCMYMQAGASSIARILGAEEKGIGLLNPVLDLDMGMQEMVKAMVGVGTSLGFTKERSLEALMKGAAAFREYNEEVEAQGKKLLESLDPKEKVFVIVTRPYGIADPVLDMNIPDLLLERGQKVISMEHLPGHDVDLSEDYPDMYWPFGQHILGAAKIIAKQPNLYAIYLTNHGCGPDTMLSHMFAQEMKDKPYLQIEVDEQYSEVGVITRLEAFMNSIEGRKMEPNGVHSILDVDHTDEKLYASPKEEKSLNIPYMGIYSDLLSHVLEKEYGLPVRVMSSYSNEIMNLGRTLTRTKEYLPFTAFGGEILKAEQEEKNGQYLLPSTLGSEADGQYARALRSAFDNHGFSSLSVITQPLELLPLSFIRWQELFYRIVCADLLYLVSEDKRESLISCLKEKKTINEKTVTELCTMIHPVSTKVIGIVGTPLCETVLNDGVLEKLEKEGYLLQRAPVSEYLLYLWQEEKTVQKEYPKSLVHMQACLEKIGRTFADSSFTTDMNELHTAADKYMYQINGANIRYRYAKAIQMSSHTGGLLLCSPRYENADMVMSLRNVEKNCHCPVYHLQFDGDWDESAEERLHSFLYYQKHTS